MPEESYDSSLFPSKEHQKAATDVWTGAQKQVEKSDPVGTFQATIDVAELVRSQSSDRLQIHYKLNILVGENKGTVLNKYDGLQTEQQAAITQQQLARLGVKTAAITMEKLPAMLLSLVGKNCSITTKKNGDFFNIYFQRLMGETVGAGNGGSGKKF